MIDKQLGLKSFAIATAIISFAYLASIYGAGTVHPYSVLIMFIVAVAGLGAWIKADGMNSKQEHP